MMSFLTKESNEFLEVSLRCLIFITTATTNIQTSFISLDLNKIPDWSLHQSPIKLLPLSNQYCPYTALIKPLFSLKTLMRLKQLPKQAHIPQLSIQIDAKGGQS